MKFVLPLLLIAALGGLAGCGKRRGFDPEAAAVKLRTTVHPVVADACSAERYELLRTWPVSWYEDVAGRLSPETDFVALTHLVSVWGEREPQGAAKWLLARPDLRFALPQAGETIARCLAGRDLPGALQFAQKLGPPFPQAVWESAAARDPIGTLVHWDECRKQGLVARKKFLTPIVQAGAARDPRAVADWLAGQPDGVDLLEASRYVLAAAWVEVDPGGAVRWALTTPQPQGLDRPEFLDAIGRALPSESLEAMEAAATALPEGSGRRWTLVQNTASWPGRTDLEAVRAWIERLESDIDRRAAREGLAARAAKARVFAPPVPDFPLPEPGTPAENYLRRRSEALGFESSLRWVQTLGAPGERFAALFVLATLWRDHDPEGARRAGDSIEDPVNRAAFRQGMN